MDSVLRPRDIQARIRSGESPEAVASAAQTSVDKIMAFAAPVLAERAYVAEQAQKASVRRRSADGPVGHLGEAVAERLESADVTPESVEWDAWRREDGRWTLVADFATAGGVRQARFVYDVAGRYVVADDDDSRWLVGERTARVPGEAVPTPEVATGDPSTTTGPLPRQEPRAPRRLASVQDEQLPMGDDAIEVVTGRRPTVDWISTQATDRPVVPEPVDPEPVDPEPADALFETPVAAPTQASALDAAPSAEPTTPELGLEQPDGPDQEPAEAPAEAHAEAPAKKPAKQSKSRGRASVPSWDEIMFGSNQGD